MRSGQGSNVAFPWQISGDSFPGLALVCLACVAVVERGRGRGNLGVRAGHAGYCPLGN